MKKQNCLIILLCFYAAISLAENASMKLIKLHYIQAEEIIPLLKPMLPEGAKISGSGYNLVIQTSKENLTKLRSVIHRLDKRPQSLEISIRRGNSGQSGRQSNIQVYETRSVGSQVQRVRVLEGRGAFIDTGQSVPFVSAVQGPFWPGVLIKYHKVSNGFWVVPHIRGSQVMLKVLSKKDNLRVNNVVELQRLSTEIIVPVGQWVPIGGVASRRVSVRQRLIYQTDSVKVQNGTLYIKVTKVGN